jgi:hypothetical protein
VKIIDDRIVYHDGQNGTAEFGHIAKTCGVGGGVIDPQEHEERASATDDKLAQQQQERSDQVHTADNRQVVPDKNKSLFHGSAETAAVARNDDVCGPVEVRP